jgi:methyl-accepting chemotaxis protein
VSDRWVKAGQTNDIIRQTSTIAIALRNMMLTSSREDMARQKDRVIESRRIIAVHVDKLKQTVNLPKGKEIFDEVLAQRDKYIAGQDKLIGIIERGAAEEARQFLTMSSTISAATRRRWTPRQVSDERSTAPVRKPTTHHQARTLMIAMVVLALVLATGIAVWIIRSVTRPMGGEPDAAKAVVEKIAQGDLTAEIAVKPGDSSSLMAATRNMQASLRKMVTELKANAEGVASAAHQLSSSSSQVATATAHQSEAASAMAAAVEEMTVSINHVADSAREAAVNANTGGQAKRTRHR